MLSPCKSLKFLVLLAKLIKFWVFEGQIILYKFLSADIWFPKPKTVKMFRDDKVFLQVSYKKTRTKTTETTKND